MWEIVLHIDYNCGLWSHTSTVQIPTLICKSCVALGKLLNLSVFQFLICKWGKWYCNSCFICHDDQMNYIWKHMLQYIICAISHHPFLAPHQVFIEKDSSFQFRILPSYECFTLWIFFPLTVFRFGFSWGTSLQFYHRSLFQDLKMHLQVIQRYF